MNLKNYSFLTLLLLLFISLFIFSDSASAQYFGKNKVMYDSFNFKVLHTKHFDVYYYPEEKEAVKYAALMAERWYARHSELLLDTLQGKQPLILYASFPQFAETNVTQGFIGQGTGGFTEPLMRRVVLPFAGPLKETNHVIGHELVHAFQYDITGKGGNEDRTSPAAEKLPLWFIEGMAEYFSLGPDYPFTAMWMREASQKKLPDLSDLNDYSKYFPYRYGQALLAYMGGKYGDRKLGTLLRVAAHVGDMKTAIDSVYSIPADSLIKDWHAATRAAYDSLVKVTSKPAAYGPELISKDKNGGDLNISPVISPDGNKVLFFSSKDMFSIDLFLADARTGKIIRKVLSTALDAHLQNLEFINSAGAWSPDGKEFVFSAVKQGRPTLTAVDVNSGDIKMDKRFPELGEIFNPTWSPDGRYIAFAGLDNGLSNLFLYNIKTDSLKKLTDDAYAELQPVWSPDGTEIAFVTDRFSTNLKDLQFGNYRLAQIDPLTGRIEPLPSFKHGKNINPQWAPDGKSIYFLSNRNGITDIYNVTLPSGTPTQVTNLFGGVSGITYLSPALSVSSKGNRLVYSVFQNNKYNIFAIDSLKQNEPRKVLTEFEPLEPGVLPPDQRVSGLLVGNMNNPYIGLPTDTNFVTTNYHTSLSLVGVGQPSLAAGADRFGTYIGGGVALFWSDMLGNHNLATALQIESSSGLFNLSGLVGYMNTSRRLQWGGVIQQVPYILGGFSSGYGTIKGEPAYIEQQYIYKQTDRQATAIFSYPFSTVFRAEMSAGYTNLSFTQKVITRAVSLNSGAVIQDNTQDLGHPAALNLGRLSAALVYDNSIFGATDPILGSRFRVEADPTFGSIGWIGVLADYRHYIMPIRPFTLAARILHSGRYGSGAEDNRLQPLFLGYPGLVRGYDYGSFTPGEFASDSLGGTNSFDNLVGSKIAVGNVELRFPLFGVFGLGSGYYGFFPAEFGFFYDAGLAWTNNNTPKIFGGDRKIVSSYGATLRINLFGYAVGEVNYVHPLNRPGDKWLWEFNLVQGF